MKRHLSFRTLALLSLMCLPLAHPVQAQLHIHAGYAGKQMQWTGQKVVQNTSEVRDTVLKLDFGPGYYGGIGYNIEISDGLGFYPGVCFNYNKQNVVNDYDLALGAHLNQDITYTMMDLSVPLMLSYTYSFPDLHLDIFAFAGPTVQYALSAYEYKVETYSGYTAPLEEKNRVEETLTDFFLTDENGDSFMKRLDVGATVGLGVSFYGACLQAGYNWGLLNRCGIADTPEATNRFSVSQFFVGLGYTVSFAGPEVYSSADKSKGNTKGNSKGKGKGKGRR